MARKADDKREQGDRRESREGREGRSPRDEGSRFGGKNRRDDRRTPPPRDEVFPAPGVAVTIVPAPEAVHLIGKEILHEARVYPLFDVAQTLLAERSRCRAVFESPEPHPFLWRGLLDESIFLTREDAARHLWTSALRARFVEEETVEADPPKGNFTTVARCGLSGEWLGPPNFHAYQSNLRRTHRERYSHLPLESYTAKIRMEKGEEALNEWLATMTQKKRWRILGQGDDAWIEDEAVAKREVALRFFDEAFEEARCVEVNASIPPTHLSPPLMMSMKQAGNHAKEHPAFLIPSLCKALETEHFPVFKRKGKLFTGPARPHPLPVGQVLAERPGIMVEWIRNNSPAKLEGLWQAVSPEGSTAPPAEYAADLYWLLQQGHILLFLDDTLVVQEVRPPAGAPSTDDPPSGKKKKKKKKRKPGAESMADEAEAEPSPISAGDPTDPEFSTESTADEAPLASAQAESTPPSALEPIGETLPTPVDPPSPSIESLPVVPDDTTPAAADAPDEAHAPPSATEEKPPSSSPSVDAPPAM